MDRWLVALPCTKDLLLRRQRRIRDRYMVSERHAVRFDSDVDRAMSPSGWRMWYQLFLQDRLLLPVSWGGCICKYSPVHQGRHEIGTTSGLARDGSVEVIV